MVSELKLKAQISQSRTLITNPMNVEINGGFNYSWSQTYI